MDTLRDPIWQFAGVVLALLALLVTVILSWAQRRSKRVACVPRVTQLLSVDAAIRSEIQVLFRKHVVQDVSLVELRFVNFGSLPVTPKDFISNLKIKFGDGAAVLTAEISSTVPHDLREELRLSLNAEAGEVTLGPMLLNAKDSFTVKCLVTAYQALSITTRIAGLRAVEIRDDEFLRRRLNWWIWIVAMPLMSLAMAWPMSNVLLIPIRTALGFAGLTIFVALTLKAVSELFQYYLSRSRQDPREHDRAKQSRRRAKHRDA